MVSDSAQSPNDANQTAIDNAFENGEDPNFDPFLKAKLYDVYYNLIQPLGKYSDKDTLTGLKREYPMRERNNTTNPARPLTISEHIWGTFDDPSISLPSPPETNGYFADTSEYGRLPGMGIEGAVVTDTPEIHSGRNNTAYWAYDIVVPHGTSYTAVAPGTAHIGDEGDIGFGKYVRVDHKHGISTYYGHNSNIKIKESQEIDSNTEIANAGNTGNTKSKNRPKEAPHYGGTHIHFEIKYNGISVPSEGFDWKKFQEMGQTYLDNEYLPKYGPDSDYYKQYLK